MLFDEVKLKEILTERDVFQRLEEVNIDNYDVLLNSGLIDLGKLLELDRRLIDNMEYTNKYLRALGIEKVTTNFIIEDIKDGLKYPEFDIVVYLSNIMTIKRYGVLYKILKNNSSLDDRKKIYTMMDSCSHSKEIESILKKLEDRIFKLLYKED